MHIPRDIVPDQSQSSAAPRLDANGHPVSANGDWLGDALGQMTGQIRQRLAEVEARHAQSLADMEARISRMSGSAHRARPELPAELASAFGRLEDGMSELVSRIAETRTPAAKDNGHFVFAPRASASNTFVFDRALAGPSSHNGSEARPSVFPVAEGEWDSASAEALMQLYESGATGVSPAALEAASHSDAALSGLQRFAAPAPATPGKVVVAGLGDDRRWVEEKFSAITTDIAQALTEARPDAAIDKLMSRVDSFEQRFEAALVNVTDGLSSVAKTSHMRQLESQIGDLAKQIVSVRQQLDRLGQIEHQLIELNALAASAQDVAQFTDTAPPAPAPVLDIAAIADAVADKASQRISALLDAPPPSGAVAPVDSGAEILLRSYMDERRKSDVATNGMLDTMQEALVRLIDRVEAIDATQLEIQRSALHGSGPAVHPAAAFAPDALASVERNVPEAAPQRPARQAVQRPAPTARAPQLRVETVELPDDVSDASQQGEPATKAVEPSGSVPLRSRVKARVNANIPEPELAAAELASDDTDAAVKKRAKPAKRSAGSSSIGRRGAMVAMIALVFVGLSYLASLLLANRYGSLFPGNANVSTPAQPSLRPSTATPPAADARSAPLPVEPPRPAPSPDRRSQAPADTRPSVEDRPVPRAIPETVTDDLSLNDDAQRPQFAQVPVPAAGASPAAAVARVAGIALDNSSGPLRPHELAAIAQQRLNAQSGLSAPAGASTVGKLAAPQPAAQKRPVVTTLNRDPDLTTRPEPAAPLPNTSSVIPAARQAASIVTGTTTSAQSISLGRKPSAPSAPAGPADRDPDAMQTSSATAPAQLPAAMVGPLSLRIAASQGDPSAAFEVGTRFAEGRGIKQDFDEAIVWYQRSAAKGFALAQYRLGTLYERGLGAPADMARARTWYKRAADQGNVKAMHNLAVISAGRDGVQPDYAEASKWFTAAAERGLADSQFNLGVLHENGLGVAKDQRAAYKWYALAARGGDKEAGRRRDALVASLDTNVLRAAEGDVASWRGRSIDKRANDARFAGDQWRHQTTSGAEPAQHSRNAPQLPPGVDPANLQAPPNSPVQPNAQPVQ